MGPLFDAVSSLAAESSKSSCSTAATKSGVPIAGLLVLELCAGTAGFTAALRNVGFDAVGIDHARCRHRPKAPIVRIDLTSTDGQNLLWRILEQGRVFYVHCAPPCGTASRARDKAIPAELRAKGAPSPKPLRSDLFPQGLPTLTGVDLEKVLQANLIYEFIAAFCSKCMDLGIFFSIENPKRSYMWLMPCFLMLAAKGAFFVNYQACRHGSDRDKWSSWLTNCPNLLKIAGPCPGGHTHKPWGVRRESGSKGSWTFATSEEAACPPELCKSAADCIVEAAVDKGHTVKETFFNEGLESDRWKLQAGVQRQPRGRKVAQLLPEFHRFVTVKILLSTSPGSESRAFSDIPVNSNSKLSADWRLVPKGSKLLRRSSNKGIAGTQQNFDDFQGPAMLSIELTDSSGETGRRTEVKREDNTTLETVWGVYATPEEFVAKARMVQHPASSFEAVEDCLLKEIFELLTKGPEAIARRRAVASALWSKRVQELSADEASLHEQLPQHLQVILKGKNLLVFQEMLCSVGYEDVHLVSDICAGFKMTGMAKDSMIFPHKLRAPSISEAELMRSAKWTRHALKVTSSGNSALDLQLFEQALKEVEDGWLQGPFSEEELSEKLGPLWVLSRRFGLLQDGGAKLRSIDDLSESFVNSAGKVQRSNSSEM